MCLVSHRGLPLIRYKGDESNIIPQKWRESVIHPKEYTVARVGYMHFGFRKFGTDKCVSLLDGFCCLLLNPQIRNELQVGQYLSHSITTRFQEYTKTTSVDIYRDHQQQLPIPQDLEEVSDDGLCDDFFNAFEVADTNVKNSSSVTSMSECSVELSPRSKTASARQPVPQVHLPNTVDDYRKNNKCRVKGQYLVYNKELDIPHSKYWNIEGLPLHDDAEDVEEDRSVSVKKTYVKAINSFNKKAKEIHKDYCNGCMFMKQHPIISNMSYRDILKQYNVFEHCREKDVLAMEDFWKQKRTGSDHVVTTDNVKKVLDNVRKHFVADRTNLFKNICYSIDNDIHFDNNRFGKNPTGEMYKILASNARDQAHVLAYLAGPGGLSLIHCSETSNQHDVNKRFACPFHTHSTKLMMEYIRSEAIVHHDSIPDGKEQQHGVCSCDATFSSHDELATHCLDFWDLDACHRLIPTFMNMTCCGKKLLATKDELLAMKIKNDKKKKKKKKRSSPDAPSSKRKKSILM